jgi:hypothetical protein
MGYRPPKGVRPPQLEGQRTGRPKGSVNMAAAWRDARWGYEHRHRDDLDPPTGGAGLWWYFAHYYPDALEAFLEDYGQLQGEAVHPRPT